MKLETQKKRAQIKVDKFNEKYPVGTTMHLLDDFGNLHMIKTYAPASIMSCQAVGWATSEKQHWGSYLLERFKPII
jgi:hypothetical protein